MTAPHVTHPALCGHISVGVESYQRAELARLWPVPLLGHSLGDDLLFEALKKGLSFLKTD